MLAQRLVVLLNLPDRAVDSVAEGVPDVLPIIPSGGTQQVTPEVTPEVGRVVLALEEELSRTDLQKALDLKDEMHFREAYLSPAIDSGLVEMTRSERPRSSKQSYRLTALGKQWLELHRSTDKN